MGTWGTTLYDSDLACDIKDEYIFLLINGCEYDEAASLTWKNLQLDKDDEDLYWIVLADVQWKYGHMGQKTLDKAMNAINAKMDEEGWSAEDLCARRRVLLKLKGKLQSPQPLEKKPKPRHGKKSNFKIGDILSVHITPQSIDFNNSPSLLPYMGKYGLVEVVGYIEEATDCGRHPVMDQCTVLLVYDWISESPPDISIINTCSILDLSSVNPYVVSKDSPVIAVDTTGQKYLEPRLIGHRETRFHGDLPQVSNTWYTLAHDIAKTYYREDKGCLSV